RLVYERAAGRLSLDRRQASRDPAADRDVRGSALPFAPGEPLRLHVFLDRSVVEVFANDRVCLSSRIYPTDPAALGLVLAVRGGKAHLRALDVWDVHTIWPGERRSG